MAEKAKNKFTVTNVNLESTNLDECLGINRESLGERLDLVKDAYVGDAASLVEGKSKEFSIIKAALLPCETWEEAVLMIFLAGRNFEIAEARKKSIERLKELKDIISSIGEGGDLGDIIGGGFSIDDDDDED